MMHSVHERAPQSKITGGLRGLPFAMMVVSQHSYMQRTQFECWLPVNFPRILPGFFYRTWPCILTPRCINLAKRCIAPWGKNVFVSYWRRFIEWQSSNHFVHLPPASKFNLFTPKDLVSLSLCCLSYNSYDVDIENLVLDQLIIN